MGGGNGLLGQVFTALVAIAGTTFLTQIIRGYLSLRTGARANTREVVKDLAAARDDEESRHTITQRDRDFWRNVAGAYAYQMRRAGLVPDPAEPVPPSEQPPTRPRPLRRRSNPDSSSG